jgi:hypothetical protein
LVHTIGRAPRSISLAVPVNIPSQPATNVGAAVANTDRIKTSTNVNPIISASQRLNTR